MIKILREWLYFRDPMTIGSWMLFWFITLLILATILLIIGLIVTWIDEMKYINEEDTGQIVDKIFNGATSSTNVGAVLGANGTMMPLVTSSSSPDKWRFAVRRQNGDITIMDVPAKTYYKLNLNDCINFTVHKGWLLKLECRYTVNL